MSLFKMHESYNLANLRKLCRDEVKRRFPTAMEGEDYTEYLTFISQESDLLFAERIRQIAAEIEERILGQQKQIIQEVYGCYKKDKK